MMLLPPAKDKCQVCAVKHEGNEPHNAQSIYYQVKFKMDNGREATWKDAMSHCDEAVKADWLNELANCGVDVEAGDINPRKKK